MVSQTELPAMYRKATLAIFPFIVAKSGDQEGSARTGGGDGM